MKIMLTLINTTITLITVIFIVFEKPEFHTRLNIKLPTIYNSCKKSFSDQFL